jgi:pyruvate-ferredoxin/flavodoxin oxidoreductase
MLCARHRSLNVVGLTPSLICLTPFCSQEMDAALPAKVKRQIAALNPQMYVVDARAVADSVGLGKRINMVMQTVFFALSGVVPISKVSLTCCY